MYDGLHSPVCELLEAPPGFHIRGPCRDAVDDLRIRHQQLFQENYPQHPLLRAVCIVRAAVWCRVRVFVVANGALLENVPARSSGLAADRNHSRRVHRASIPRPQRERCVKVNDSRHLNFKTLFRMMLKIKTYLDFYWTFSWTFYSRCAWKLT